jgi:hypothetical protein
MFKGWFQQEEVIINIYAIYALNVQDPYYMNQSLLILSKR